MTKCILCASNFEVSHHARFCNGCEERAIFGLYKLVSRAERLPEHFEERSTWDKHELLELAERSIIESVQRLGSLYEEDGKLPPIAPSSDPVQLLMLVVSVASEVRRLRSRMSALSTEVQSLRVRESRKDLADLGMTKK